MTIRNYSVNETSAPANRCAICGMEIPDQYEICDDCCEDPRDDMEDVDDGFDSEVE